MTYQEHPTVVSGVVLWTATTGATTTRSSILPDGCVDLIWDGRRLFVAGPDRVARRHDAAAGTRYAALRFAGGTGPALLGVPADQVLDQCPDLEELWPAAEARRLVEQVAPDPVVALEAWVADRASVRPVDPLGTAVLGMAGAGLPVTAMAGQVGLSPRQLHRRCLPLFGYGPRRLGRIVRLRRALDDIRRGGSLARVAAACGYADQAHLSREVRDLAGSSPASFQPRQPSRTG